MGRIESGIIEVGDQITVLPSGRISTIRQILTLDGELERAFAPQSVTFVLADDLDVSRGDMIVKVSDSVRVVREYDADICWLGEQPIDTRRKYAVRHTTKTVKALIPRIDYRVDVNTLEQVSGVSELKMNDIGRVGVKVQQPLVVDSYIHNRATGNFIVIDEVSNNTVAAGMIV
jgi:sulfate adenylyltransferase subunit 1